MGPTVGAAAPADSKAIDQPMPGARSALILLIVINLFNYIDRYVLAAVLPKIQETLLAGDPSAKQKLGWLTTVFMVSYMITSPIFGVLADRRSRWGLIAVGVIVWSLASGASGLAHPMLWLDAYWILLITRCFVGIGEAAYGPVAPTIISDYYPVQRRGSVLAWFYMAIPVGGALGYLLGGFVADWQWLSEWGVPPMDRWRWAFYLVVPPGILLGVWCLFMREPPRGQADGAITPAGRQRWSDYLVLGRTPSYVLNTLGMTAMTFAVGGVAVWMPTYIYERESHFQVDAKALASMRQGSNPVPGNVVDKLSSLEGSRFESRQAFIQELRIRLTPDEFETHRDRLLDDSRGLRLGSVNLIFSAITVVAGLAATLLGGIAGDRLRPRYSGSYFLVSGVGMIVGLPCFLLILVTPLPWSWVFVFLAVFCLFFNTGPTNTILANVTHPSIRASAFALNILIIHALGDAISPPIIGAIADHFEAQGMSAGASLGTAFQIVSIMILVSGVFWLLGTRYLARDTAAALLPLALSPPEPGPKVKPKSDR